jgi:hypothetical protein
MDHAQKKQFYCCLAPTAQKSSHVVTIQRVHWRTDCCLATNYKHSSYWDTASIVARFNVFTELLPGKAFIKSVTILIYRRLYLHPYFIVRTPCQTTLKFKLYPAQCRGRFADLTFVKFASTDQLFACMCAGCLYPLVRSSGSIACANLLLAVWSFWEIW